MDCAKRKKKSFAGRLLRASMSAFLLAVVATLVAQDTKAPDAKAADAKPPDAKTPEMPPAELVRVAVENEVAASTHPGALHMFRSHKQTPKVSQTRLYVETTDALAAMLVAVNDQPLNPEQQQGETNHLAGLMKNPDQLRNKRKREKEDEQRTLQIVKALPNAFLYQYANSEKSDKGEAAPDEGSPMVKLTFTPNPAYSPPSRVEQVLAGLQGYLLIDTKARRLARIDGTLMREVSFGWGIIGRLDKGGHFLVQQADLGLGDGSWGITEINLSVTGKLLLFKGLNMVSDEVLTDFRKMPENLTFAQGVEMLKTEQEKLAHSMHADQPHADPPTEAQKTPQ
jgi:hypothetical protein